MKTQWKGQFENNLEYKYYELHAMKPIAQFSQGPYPKWILIKHHIEQVHESLSS